MDDNNDRQDATGTTTGHRQDTDRLGLSVGEAAAILGVTPDAIRARLHRGTLAGEKQAGTWRVWLPDDVPDQPDRQDTDRTDPVGQQDTRQDATGPRQDAPTGEAEALRAHVAHLAGEVDYLRGELAARSRELASERERADVLQQLALQRIPALAGGDDPPQPPAQAAPEGRHAPIRATTAQDARPWWRRILGLEK